jgi:hypothetical protein
MHSTRVAHLPLPPNCHLFFPPFYYLPFFGLSLRFTTQVTLSLYDYELSREPEPTRGAHRAPS